MEKRSPSAGLAVGYKTDAAAGGREAVVHVVEDGGRAELDARQRHHAVGGIEPEVGMELGGGRLRGLAVRPDDHELLGTEA